MTDRGYTGHEQLDHLQLVHMNGRIYDPVIGRMLSPDPLIQAPENLQSFNRYSYVWNNPLSNSDPSGFVTEMLGSSDSPNGSSNGTKPIVISPENLSVKDMLKNISEKKNCTSESTTESKTFSEDGGSSTTTESADITRDEISNASTGSGEAGDNVTGYKYKKDAAKAALDGINPQSIVDGNEYGGFIYKGKNVAGETMYFYTNPVTDGKGKELSVDTLEKSMSSIPDGAVDVGMYHTHGSSSGKGTEGDNKFSGDDRVTLVYFAGGRDYASYLGTPSGVYKAQYYDKDIDSKNEIDRIIFPLGDTFYSPPRGKSDPDLYNSWQPQPKRLFD